MKKRALTDKQITEAGALKAGGMSIEALGRKYGLHPSTMAQHIRMFDERPNGMMLRYQSSPLIPALRA